MILLFLHWIFPEYTKMKTFLRIFAAIVAAGIALCGVFLLRRTYIEPWLAVAIGVCGGAVVARLLMRRAAAVTGIARGGLAIAVLFLVASGVMFGGVLTVNYAGADDSGSRLVEATIVSKRSRAEHPTRRVGRGRYVPDTSRTIYRYYYTLRLPDGHTVEKATTAGSYRHIAVGSHQSVALCRGALGWNVIKC